VETVGDTIRIQSEENRLSMPRKRILMVEDDARAYEHNRQFVLIPAA
jgi:hypothetical protein